jgi:hypothetical protein
MRPGLVLLALALLCVLVVACGDAAPTQTPVIIVVTATPQLATETAVPPSATSIPPSETPAPPTLAWDDLHATAVAWAEATRAVEAHATGTAYALHPPPPTAPPPPTPRPTSIPTFGDTQPIDAWTFSLAKMTGPHTEIEWTQYGNTLLCNGHCWYLYIDAKNTANQTRALSSLRFTLSDDHDAVYEEDQAGVDVYTIQQFISLQGRKAIAFGVTPRDVTHSMLIFDIAKDALPAVLTVTSKTASSLGIDRHIAFVLGRKK